jgi:hypothetical protein
MPRLPFFNLVFFLIVTMLTIQHSISLNRSGGNRLINDYDLNVIGQLDQLWQRSIMMQQWMLEYKTSSWQSMHAPSGAEADLIEARFHVANAEVFGAALGEKTKTKVELDRAENDLIAARPLVADPILPAVESIRQELEGAKTDLTSIRSESRDHYEKIKTDLDHLIKTLRDTQA